MFYLQLQLPSATKLITLSRTTTFECRILLGQRWLVSAKPLHFPRFRKGVVAHSTIDNVDKIP